VSPRLTLATARRVLLQVLADHRSLAMILVVPLVLVGLLAWILPGELLFDRIGPALLGIFPMVVVFLVTSITTLRERTSGTLERLLSTPVGKGDILGGYAVALGSLAVLQALLATGFAVWVCGLEVRGPGWLLVVVAVATSLVGTATGLFTSAFARTEFQAVQFMPATVFPQLLLCGLVVAREDLPPVLEALSAVLPLSYAVDAMDAVATRTDPVAEALADVGILLAFCAASLVLGSLTLRRRTP
jgi:ABC-2 type transport system permease protein